MPDSGIEKAIPLPGRLICSSSEKMESMAETFWLLAKVSTTSLSVSPRPNQSKISELAVPKPRQTK